MSHLFYHGARNGKHSKMVARQNCGAKDNQERDNQDGWNLSNKKILEDRVVEW